MTGPANAMDRLLDLARWAPSGDNTQPWQFEVQGDTHLVVHGCDTSAHCVYDLDGRPSQLAIGALIETLAIAASAFQWRADVDRRGGLPESRPTFDVKFVHDPSLAPNPLIRQIPRRSVNRRPYQTSALKESEKLALTASVADGYELMFMEGWSSRWQAAKLMFRNAKIRLTTEEAYLVHADIIAWGRRYSVDKVPDQALGVDALTLRFMQWAMQDWRRVQFLNQYAAGTWLPRLQLDWLPSMLCAAHVLIIRRIPPTTVDHYVDAGRAVQRFWLTASALGLQHQPEMTPLIFSRYVREKRVFSQSAEAMALATGVARLTECTLGPALDRAVWMGRLGHALPAQSRSLRKSRDQLRLKPEQPKPVLPADGAIRSCRF